MPATGIASSALTPPPDVTGFPLLNGIVAGNLGYTLSVIHHMILPALAIALLSFGVITRLTRSSMLDAMESDYFKLELMKGVERNKAIYGTALRNASIPIVTLLALTFGYAVAGAVVVEDIFDYHGMGWFIVQAIYSTDYIAILGTTIIIAISITLAFLGIDIAITSISAGIERKASVILIIIFSSQPPLYPDIIPSNAPITIALNTTITDTKASRGIAYSILETMDSPRSFVPNTIDNELKDGGARRCEKFVANGLDGSNK